MAGKGWAEAVMGLKGIFILGSPENDRFTQIPRNA